MIKNIISRFTMVKTGRSFWDNSGQKEIYNWRDCYFQKFAAASRWGYRMQIK